MFASVPAIVLSILLMGLAISVVSLQLTRQLRVRRHIQRLRTLPLERSRA